LKILGILSLLGSLNELEKRTKKVEGEVEELKGKKRIEKEKRRESVLDVLERLKVKYRLIKNEGNVYLFEFYLKNTPFRYEINLSKGITKKQLVKLVERFDRYEGLDLKKPRT
jgi:hypothetical protein